MEIESALVKEYVDVHTHLTHEAFENDRDEVIQRAILKGLGAIVVNGTGPQSNREILKMAEQYQIIKAALGIYPIEAVNEELPQDFKFRCERFSVRSEIEYIRNLAVQKKISAVGECGLDAYHLGPETFPKQEEVFRSLIEIAKTADLPIIVHSRKREERTLDILAEHNAKRVDLHCYSGKVALAIRFAEEHGWCFSIPANIKRSKSFQALARRLPEECILTETDAPYLGPEMSVRNEPMNVVQTIEEIARLRHWDVDFARTKIWANYNKLFF